MRYQVPEKTIRMFFHLGIIQGFPVRLKNELKTETWYFGDYTEKYSGTAYNHGYEFGFVFGMGAEYKKFSAELRYIGFNRNVQKHYLTSNTHTLLFLVGYHL